MKKYHTIIIGAGPAGLSCALSLLENNIKDILVIEKNKFPRYKCCAGYITNKTKQAYQKYGLDIEKCHYSLIKDFNIYYKNKKKQTIENKFLYTNEVIDRVELDNNFYLLAKEKNINILENTSIIKHNIDSKTITLSNKEELVYDNLVFADGTMSFSSRYQKNKKKNIAMQLIVKNQNIENKIDIHFGITKKGYGWVSSNNGVVNIGLTDVFDSNVDYHKIFKEFLNLQNIDTDINDLKGAFTPIGIRTPLLNDNIYFVGDALGACDPLTLSGLRYGLKSGEVCAKSIAKNNNKIFKRYANKLKFKFNLMKVLLKIFYLKSTLFIVFNIACKYFGKFVATIFNNFFVNKK